MRVLIAEDDRVSALVLRRALEKLGHQVVAAENGEAAWALFQTSPCRVVITDWMMPKMDGPSLCARIRDREKASPSAEGDEEPTPYTYVILLTAKSTRDDRLAGLAAGADDFLVKPLDPAELGARLHVAQRILCMEKELQARSAELEEMGAELAQRNEELQRNFGIAMAARSQFETLFGGLPVACFTFDEAGRIQRWNQEAERITGFPEGLVIGRFFWEVLPGWHKPETAQGCIERVFAGERSDGVEWSHVTPLGQTVHLLTNTFPLRDGQGCIIGAINASVDITERKRLSQALEQQLFETKRLADELSVKRAELEEKSEMLSERARRDGLTNLLNHRSFHDVLESLFASRGASRLEVSVAMLDVDHFKQFNDSFGHPAGDDVLRTVASLLASNVRAHDTAARYGGEEFAVVMPGTDAEGALALAERIRTTIERHAWPLRPLTVSVGVATAGRGLDTPSSLVDAADRALYKAKESGRNRTLAFDGSCRKAARAARRAA